MAISFLQRANQGGPSGNTLQASFGSGITAGSIIAAAGCFSFATTSLVLDDGLGDAVTSVVGVTRGTGVPIYRYWCSAFLAPTTGAITITATYNGTPATGDLFIWEIAGLTSAHEDKSPNTGNLLTTAADSGPTGTLSASAEAAISYGIASQFSAYTGAGSGWSNGNVNGITGSLGQERVVATNASINGTGTVTPGNGWDILAATFQSSGGDTLVGRTTKTRMLRRISGWTPPLVDHRRRVLRPNRALLIPKLILPKAA